MTFLLQFKMIEKLFNFSFFSSFKSKYLWGNIRAVDPHSFFTDPVPDSVGLI